MKQVFHALYYVFQLATNMFLISFFMMHGGVVGGVNFETTPKTVWFIIACCLMSCIFSFAEAMRICSEHGKKRGE